jgi:RluA family pseudouridine synthase
VIIRETHLVPEGVERMRLSTYARTAFAALISRKGTDKAIKRGELLIDGKTAGTGDWVKPGQVLELIDLQQRAPKTFHLPLDVVFEDECIAIINKPPGIEVSGNKFKTVENALAGSLRPSSAPDALPWARPVHRLDYSTSGLLLVAKTAQAQMELGRQFEERTVHKRYSAVVSGQPESTGEITSPINGLSAHSLYSTLKTVPSLKSGSVSLMHLFPHTGRTHQLRIHMASLGCPIVGDHKYGPEGHVLRGKGLFLAATRLEFVHPETQEKMTIQIDDPPKFASFLQREERRWQKYNG